VIRAYFHRWEQELAAVSQSERLVRPFEWGEDWIDEPKGLSIQEWVDGVMRDTDAFYTPEPTRYTFTKAPDAVRATGEEGVVTFASGFTTPHPENNTVVCRYFPPNPFIKR
jgi:hypothetical protein